MNPLLEAICAAAAGASDILLAEGRVPQIRMAGQLLPLEAEPLEGGFFDDLWLRCGAGEGVSDFDAGLSLAGGERFRVNLFRSLGRRGAVLRRVRAQIPDLDSLGLPADILRRWISNASGLVLVCGPSGSGKTTTLAAMLGELNRGPSRHVVTIEDPVEYAFSDGNCLFTQREVGIDTPSFEEGLRRSLRQDPDVILIGEIRDAVTASTALQASETGHLVLASLHSSSVPEAVERLQILFPVEAREGVRRVLSTQLVGVLCQRLLPASGGSLAVACEYCTNVGLLRQLVAGGKTSELVDAIGKADGRETRSLLHSLVPLVQSGTIAEEVAVSAAGNSQELLRALRGVTSSSTWRTSSNS